MKRLIILALLFVFHLMSFSQVHIIPVNSNKTKERASSHKDGLVEVTFALDSIKTETKITGKGKFQRISAPGLYSKGEIGSPELPAYKKLIEIPQGATIDVDISSFLSQSIKLTKIVGNDLIFPVQPSRSKKGPVDSTIVVNSKAYKRNNIGTKPEVTVEVLGSMRGVQIARLTVSPFQYNPEQNVLKVYNDIELNIHFKGIENLNSKSTAEAAYTPLFEPVYNQVDQLVKYNDHPDLTKYPIKYLIVAPDSFRSALKPFINWKIQQGFQVVEGYTSIIGATTTEIQSWIHDQYNNASGLGTDQKPTYLLIVGDIQHIPTFIGSQTSTYTDLPYASVDGDYFPDMYYGRFSVVNTSQLNAIIEKTCYYEQYLFDEPEYLDRVTLIAGIDASYNPTHGRPTIRYARDNYFNTANGYDTVFFYESDYTNCYTTIDTGIGFINYTAHGTPTSWFSPLFTNSHVAALSNEGKYPLAIGNCCEAGCFGVSECFGEKWIREPQKGGVVYIGSAPETYWDEDVYWSVGAFSFVGNGTTPLYEETTMGAYDAPCNSDYLSASAMMFVGNLSVTEADLQSYTMEVSPEYYWQAYNLLGDPSLVPYFKQGLVNTVSHLDYYPKGTSWFEVSAMPGSYVGISSDSILLGASFVDSLGYVNIPVIDTIDVAWIAITVTKPQYQPYIDTISVIYPEGPYVHVRKVDIDDTIGGNSNNLMEYEEEIFFDVTVKNLGNQPATADVNVTISTNDGYIIVLDSTENYGIIDTTDGLDIVRKEDAFLFQVTNYIPDLHKAKFTYKATDGDSIWTSEFYKTLYAPVLERTNINIDDSLYGNQDCILDPGEQAVLTISIANTGHSDIENIVATILNSDPYLSMSNTSDSISVISEGETIIADFSLAISPSVPENYILNLPLAISGGWDDQFVWNDTLELQVNYAPEYLMMDGSISACRGLFYDSGGGSDNYKNNENKTLTIYPCYEGQAVTVYFSEFNLEEDYDYLYIYNGSNTSDPQIEGSPFTSIDGPDYVIADNAEGSLTFRFYSDVADVVSGWEATIDCIDPTIVPECTTIINPPEDTTDIMPIVELQWEHSDRALKYYIYFDTTSTSMAFYDSTTLCSMPIPEVLQPFTTYYWKVVPVNHAGSAEGCNVWSFTTGGNIILQKNDTLTLCSGFYFDAGGIDGSYPPNQDQTLVLIPSQEGYRISIKFNEFVTESGYDYLYIHDSINTSGAQVAGSPFTGTNSPGTVTGYNEDGALTLRFVSDGFDNYMGWRAEIRCKPINLSVDASAASNQIFRGDSVQLFALADGGYETYTYKWYSYPVDTELVDTTIANPFAHPQVGTKYTVYVNDGDTIVWDTISVKVREYLPHVVIPYADADTIVRGTSVNLSAIVTGGTENYSYLWRAVPEDSSLIDSTGLSIEVSPRSTTNYTLYVNDNYTIRDSTITVIVLEPSLNAFIPITEYTICLGDTAFIEVDASGGYGITSYSWQSYPIDVNFVDTLDPSISVYPSNNTQYIVHVKDKYQTIMDTARVVVRKFPDPLIVSIQSNSLLVSNYAGTNYWYLDDTLISGENNQSLEPDISGYYHAVAYADECLSGPSEKIYFNLTGQKNYANLPEEITLYPNPFTDYCEVSLNSKDANDKINSIELYDISGNIVKLYKDINAKTFLLKKGDLTAGIYFIKIYTSEIYSGKVIVII